MHICILKFVLDFYEMLTYENNYTCNSWNKVYISVV